MATIGIRELKQQTSKILRRVRERGETVDITYHGKVVARLVPVNPVEPSSAEMGAVLANLDQLSAEISAAWPDGVTALDALNDIRRDL